MNPPTEFAAALLQAAITGGLALLSLALFRRYRKAHFGWWALAWLLYTLRIGVIIAFLSSDDRTWLFWHQVITGWTALAILWAATVFSRAARWRARYLVLVLFPFAWSYVSIYRLENFMLAAGPAVAFLSVASLWTAWVFLRHRRRTGSRGSGLLAWTFVLWAIHHLDYPILRARGAWDPWGYYLDIAFLLLTGTGILILVVEDVERGLRTLGALSGPLGAEHDALDALLARPLALPGVRGSAMYARSAGAPDARGTDVGNAVGNAVDATHGRGRFVHGTGCCAAWTGRAADGAMLASITDALARREAVFAEDWPDPERPEAAPFAFAAVLPLARNAREAHADQALVIVGDARDPFTALDAGFLTVLGRQVGQALETSELARHLQQRTSDLEFLSRRMVRQHEEERRRLSFELHDETAQVFAAVKLQLGVVQEEVPPALAERIGRAVSLVDAGMRGIRNVTNDLRPSLLDDLGLLPALRSLAAEVGERRGVPVSLEAPAALPVITDEAEVALFRALQEALSNVSRHAADAPTHVRLQVAADRLTMTIRDEGPGFEHDSLARYEREGHLGLVGMRERIAALRGTLSVETRRGGGVTLTLTLPLPTDDGAD